MFGLKKKRGRYVWFQGYVYVVDEIVRLINDSLEKTFRPGNAEVTVVPAWDIIKSIQGCTVFEINTPCMLNTVKDLQKHYDDIYSDVVCNGYVDVIARKIYEDSGINTYSKMKLYFCSTDRCPKSKGPGMLLYWDRF